MKHRLPISGRGRATRGHESLLRGTTLMAGLLAASIAALAGPAAAQQADQDQAQNPAEAGPGDFIYVPPRVIHAERNLSDTEPFVFVVSRNSGTMTTVNVEVGEPTCDRA